MCQKCVFVKLDCSSSAGLYHISGHSLNPKFDPSEQWLLCQCWHTCVYVIFLLTLGPFITCSGLRKLFSVNHEFHLTLTLLCNSWPSPRWLFYVGALLLVCRVRCSIPNASVINYHTEWKFCWLSRAQTKPYRLCVIKLFLFSPFTSFIQDMPVNDNMLHMVTFSYISTPWLLN